MTDPSKKRGDSEPEEHGADAAETPEEEVAAEAATSEASDTAGDEIEPADRVEELEAQNAELTDRFVRVAADMENLRRRTERDIKDARSYSIANFGRDMLGVADNLRRALDAIPEDARKGEDAGFKALIDGVEMTERSMLSALEKHGVKKLEPEGERFDPHFHQAMFEVADANVAPNTVVQVVQAGYVIGDRVLRPAMVGIAKGGPKEAAEPAPEAADEKTEKEA